MTIKSVSKTQLAKVDASKLPTVTLKKGEGLLLRTCSAGGFSWGGFQWPNQGKVTCPDWNKTAVCGGGLHGLLWGVGNGSYLEWQNETAVWLVVKVKLSEVVNIDGDKVKVPQGTVVYFGDRATAIAIIEAHAPAGSIIVGGTATAGDRGTATAGYRGTATAGYSGTATAGYSGTATAGDRGTATAGAEGTIVIRYWNGNKYRTAMFEVGENGILPNVAYQVDSSGKPRKA